MLEIGAEVVRVTGNTAWVRIEAPSSCGACGGRGCGRSLFAHLFHHGAPEHPVHCLLKVTTGDTVVLGIPEGALLRAAAWAYLLPLSLVFLGALGLSHWGEMPAVGGALAGLIAGYMLMRSRLGQDKPIVLRRGEALPFSCGSE